jgi:hypothetical protein
VLHALLISPWHDHSNYAWRRVQFMKKGIRPGPRLREHFYNKNVSTRFIYLFTYLFSHCVVCPLLFE